jgi:hypothetical protein
VAIVVAVLTAVVGVYVRIWVHLLEAVNVGS